MHRYHEQKIPNLSPWLVIGVWVVLVMILACALYEGPPHHEVGVRHELPDPYVPQCYATEWRSGSYCEFIPVKKG